MMQGHVGATSELSAQLKAVIASDAATAKRVAELSTAARELEAKRAELHRLQQAADLLRNEMEQRERNVCEREARTEAVEINQRKTEEIHAERIRVLDRREREQNEQHAARQEHYDRLEKNLAYREAQLAKFRDGLAATLARFANEMPRG
jgi:hypothetical protein